MIRSHRRTALNRTTHARAHRVTGLSPRFIALASIATIGGAVQIGWLIMLAQGAAFAVDWLF